MTHWSDGSRLTADDLNMIVGRIEALEACPRSVQWGRALIMLYPASNCKVER